VRPKASEDTDRGRTIVVVILAIGLATAVNLITFATLYIAVFHVSDVPQGLSENATQILTGAFGGIIGVLGSYIGYRAGQQQADATKPTPPEASIPDADEEV